MLRAFDVSLCALQRVSRRSPALGLRFASWRSKKHSKKTDDAPLPADIVKAIERLIGGSTGRIAAISKHLARNRSTADILLRELQKATPKKNGGSQVIKKKKSAGNAFTEFLEKQSAASLVAKLKREEVSAEGESEDDAITAPNQKTREKLPFYMRHTEGMLSDLEGSALEDVAPLSLNTIPKLTHGLNRVLTSSGVQWLQEPRSQFYNYPTWLKSIPDVDKFAFERVEGFVTSSSDEDLLRNARGHGCSFAGSTSSLTGMLSQIYLLLSGEKPIDTSALSGPFQKEPKNFTPGQRMPVSVSLSYRDGVYATDSDAARLGKSETILSQLGILLEKFFTTPSEEFNKTLMRGTPVPLPLDHAAQKTAYRYAKYGKFMMRAQLDCHYPHLPGTGVFDIKTRAAMPIRYDLQNWRVYADYQIRTVQGARESFEKEYYDLIRSAFLKYSFQARIGNMDGVFVAYHNTAEIFGFQYIPLEEMDMRLFGHTEGARVFIKCVGLLNKIFEEIVLYFPEKSINCTWETQESGHMMHIWIEPRIWEGDDKPVIQLDVKVINYLDMEKVSGSAAVESTDRTWTVGYSITKSSLSQNEVRAKRRAAFDRQLLIYKYGLNLNERVEHSQDIDLAQIDPLANAPRIGKHSHNGFIEEEEHEEQLHSAPGTPEPQEPSTMTPIATVAEEYPAIWGYIWGNYSARVTDNVTESSRSEDSQAFTDYVADVPSPAALGLHNSVSNDGNSDVATLHANREHTAIWGGIWGYMSEGFADHRDESQSSDLADV